MNYKYIPEVKKGTERQSHVLSILWLVPVLVLGYIGWLNLLPLGGTITYIIDVGGEDTRGRAIITAPYDRLSDRKEMDGITYRELRENLVYFMVDDHKLDLADEVTVRVRFRDNLPSNASFMVGARNTPEWGYDWKEGYVPFYRELSNIPLLSADGRIFLYAIKPENKSDFQRLDDFLEGPPLGSVIATNDNNLNVNQILDLNEMPRGYYATVEKSGFMPVSVSHHGEDDTLLVDTSLRGGHTLWTYVEDGYLELKVTKEDLNWYDNSDELGIEVYSSNRELMGKLTIPDDGEEGSTNIMGPSQQETLKIEGLEPGAYRIETTGGSDLLIRAIAINQNKMVIERSVYLAGMNAAYFKDGPAPDPVRLYTRIFKAGQINLRTYHNPGLQQVAIQGNDFSTNVDINKVNTDFITSLAAGSYQLTFPEQDVLIEHEGYFSFTPDSFFIPQRCQVTDLKYDRSWLNKNIDYLLVNLGNYVPPEEDDGDLIMQTTWKREELLVTDNKLSFCFNVPHLTRPGESEKTIPVDWIEITLRIPPLYEK